MKRFKWKKSGSNGDEVKNPKKDITFVDNKQDNKTVPIKTKKSKLLEIWKPMQEDLINFCNTSTMHGLRHIVQPYAHKVEKFLWFAMVMIFIYCSWVLTLVQINRYTTNPTVVSIKKNFREWTTIFPAITVCLTDNVDQNLARDFIERTWNRTETDEQYSYYLEYIQLVTTVLFRSNVRQFWKYEKDSTLDNIELMSIVGAVTPEVKIRTTVHDRQHKVEWESVVTEMGVCKTFNSVFSRYQSVDTWRKRKANNNKLPSFTAKTNLLTCNYMNKQCYARFSIINTTGKYYIHSPYELAEYASNPTEILEEGEELDAEFRTSYMKADPAVRSLNIRQRGCKYPDELISPTIPAYSNALCQMECRNRLALAFCGCRPFFYIVGDGKPCDTKGMACIGRNMEILINLPINLAKCTCVPQCTEMNYIPHMMKLSNWNTSNPSSVFERITSAKYSLAMPKVMMHKDLIFTFEDLIASFGGTGVLFLGISFFSIVEIILFICQLTRKFIIITRCCIRK